MWISPLRRIAALTPLLLCGNAQAQDPSPPARTGPPWLEPVTVTAPLPREHIFTRSEIQATPAANRDLSSLISTLPSIRLDNAAADSADRGSLDVPNIVIHGASPYQNLFLLNGVDATSRVDPANKDRQLGSVPGNPQAYFLDTALLGEVRVFDSGIPVEYGTFTGGVVDARLRRPSGGNHVEFGYRWNGSNLTRQKIPDYDAEQWAQGEPGFSPTWRKRFYTVTTDLSLGEQSAVILGGSRRESRIGRWRLAPPTIWTSWSTTTIWTASITSSPPSTTSRARRPPWSWTSSTRTGASIWSAMCRATRTGATSTSPRAWA